MRCILCGAISFDELEVVLSNARANIPPSRPQLVWQTHDAGDVGTTNAGIDDGVRGAPAHLGAIDRNHSGFCRGKSGERVAYAADVMALEGSIEEAPGGLQVAVTRWLSGTGAEVDHAPATLILPAAKIDHMLVLGGDA